MIRFLMIFFLIINAVCRAEDPRDYLVEDTHPFYSTMEALFNVKGVLSSEKSLEKRGFHILALRAPSFVVVKHHKIPGYVIKAHLEGSGRSLQQKWDNFISRCTHALAIRQLIQEQGLKHFVVPDKKIYVTNRGEPILLATDMNILSYKESEYAWKHVAKKKHIEELYCLLQHGYGSSKLPENIPYTKEGFFALIDTERPPKIRPFSHFKEYLSKPMQDYFHVISKGEDS